MTKKKTFSIIAIVLLVLTLGGVAVYGFMQAAQYKRDMQYGYRRALNDLSDHVGNIQTALDKAVYANTATEQTGLAAKLMREASMAKASLAVLPVGDNSLENVSRFITQVGDFSMTLARRVSAGGKITDDEYKSMQNLENYSQKLDTDISAVNMDFSGSPEFHDSMKDTAKDFSDFPSLIYDGPFSSSVMNRKPQMTEGKAVILQGNAENTAAEFLNTDQKNLTHTQDTAGSMPTFNFSANGGAISISVTKAGGLVSEMSNARSVGSAKLSCDDAKKKAAAFLEEHGYRNMTERYHMTTDGICLINYAYEQNGILCYPDLVKVGVALDNGEIVRFEPEGYLMNHKDRSLAVKLTEDQARKSVSPHLAVQQARPALIPTLGNSEQLTYEFQCTGTNKEDVLVYIDAATGYEANILILQKSQNGVLAK